MSIYKEMYYAAAATAIGSASLIRSPWASYTAVAIGAMVSDPEGMADAARNWRSGATSELTQLDQQLGQLKNQLKEQGKWEGGAFTAFETVHDNFRNSVTQLKNIRTNTGDAVDSSQDFFKWGAIGCSVIAGAMLLIAMTKYASNLGGPVGRVAGLIWEKAAGQATLRITKEMLKKHGKVVLVLSGLMYLVVKQTESTGKVFPGLKAMPTEMTTATVMPFMNDGMTYDPNTGALLPKPDDSLTNPYGGGQFPTPA
ncbi:MAG TPA: WXG100 family type VII secretion target [Nonomuraea sp.]|nr:WXG100 family type VII secretion target [Nonomuraea sp.]